MLAALATYVLKHVQVCVLHACKPRRTTDQSPTVYGQCSEICDNRNVHRIFYVEYIYGFVWWGVCKQSRWRQSVTEPSEDSGYVLLWQHYDNNKMVAMRYYGNVSFCCWRCVYWACYRCILHLQQYSHRLNLFFWSRLWRKDRVIRSATVWKYVNLIF